MLALKKVPKMGRTLTRTTLNYGWSPVLTLSKAGSQPCHRVTRSKITPRAFETPNPCGRNEPGFGSQHPCHTPPQA